MTDLTLFIGNKNYSSWSLRPWLVLRKAGIEFKEEMIQLDVPGFKDKLNALSDAGTVPVLKGPGFTIPDSLAISEWAAKQVLPLWPVPEKKRDQARALVQKMHTGFAAIRREAPMNLRRRTDGPMPADCLAEAREIDDLWCACLAEHDGPFLFDHWTIADAFFAPVATRFESYGLPRSPKADAYISELMSDEDFQEWEAAAFAESWTIAGTDNTNLP